MIKAWCRMFTSLNKMLVRLEVLWSFVIKAWCRLFPSLNKMLVEISRLNHRFACLQVWIKNESRFDGQSCRVLVLPVHSRETRHVSFLSRRVSRETRLSCTYMPEKNYLQLAQAHVPVEDSQHKCLFHWKRTKIIIANIIIHVWSYNRKPSRPQVTR